MRTIPRQAETKMMQIPLLARGRFACFALALLPALVLPATASADELPGQRIFICGHSFHVGIGGSPRPNTQVKGVPLQEVAELAGIKDQKIVGWQFLGGSQVLKHWNQTDDKDKVRKALRMGEVDVLTLSPTSVLPDEGIDHFTALSLDHNPKVRIFVQQSWASFDSPTKDRKNFKNEDRDHADIEVLRESHAPFFKKLADQIQSLNDEWTDKAQRQVVYLVPAGRAVLTLREKVAAGMVPGITRQSDLFRDPTGHGKGAVTLLTAYCYYASIYGRSPVGLPVPSVLNGQGGPDQKSQLNRMLQEIAWEAVTSEPLTGVTR